MRGPVTGVLKVARQLFSERGMDNIREVARRAGVGAAILYRRFPVKQMLVDAAFADEMRSCQGVVDDGCADPDHLHPGPPVAELRDRHPGGIT